MDASVKRNARNVNPRTARPVLRLAGWKPMPVLCYAAARGDPGVKRGAGTQPCRESGLS